MPSKLLENTYLYFYNHVKFINYCINAILSTLVFISYSSIVKDACNIIEIICVNKCSAYYEIIKCLNHDTILYLRELVIIPICCDSVIYFLETRSWRSSENMTHLLKSLKIFGCAHTQLFHSVPSHTYDLLMSEYK